MTSGGDDAIPGGDADDGDDAPVDPRIDAARARAAAGDLDAALGLLEAVVRDVPDDAEAHRDLGLVQRARGDLDAARTALARAVELDDEDAATRQSFARVLDELGRADEAVYQLVRAAAIDPEDASIAHDLGVAFERRGRHAKAIAALSRAATLRPDARTSYALGLAHEGAHDMASAIGAYRDAVERDPRFVDAHLALADALAGLGEHGEAIDVYDRLLRVDRTNVQAAHNRDVLDRARAQARADRLLGRDRDALSSGALVGQSGMKLESAWSAPEASGTRDVLLPRLVHKWPRDRVERWTDRLSDLYVDIAGGTMRALTIVLRDPVAAAREKDRWGLQLVGSGDAQDVDYVTGVHVALLRDALGLTLTESARIWRKLVGGETHVTVGDAVVERASFVAPDVAEEIAGVRVSVR